MSFGGISSDTIAEHSQVEDLEDLQDGAGGDGHGSDSSIDSKIPYMKAKHPAGTTRNLPTRSDSDNSIKDERRSSMGISSELSQQDQQEAVSYMSSLFNLSRRTSSDNADCKIIVRFDNGEVHKYSAHSMHKVNFAQPEINHEFLKGVRIIHPKRGEGTIVAIKNEEELARQAAKRRLAKFTGHAKLLTAMQRDSHRRLSFAGEQGTPVPETPIE